MSLPQRMQYGLACTHYLSGLRDLVYLAVPFFFLLMGVSAIAGTDLPAFLSRFLPYYALSQIAFWRVAWGKTTCAASPSASAASRSCWQACCWCSRPTGALRCHTQASDAGASAGAPLLGQMLAGAGCLVGLIMAAVSQEDQSRVLLSAAWLLGHAAPCSPAFSGWRSATGGPGVCLHAERQQRRLSVMKTGMAKSHPRDAGQLLTPVVRLGCCANARLGGCWLGFRLRSGVSPLTWLRFRFRLCCAGSVSSRFLTLAAGHLSWASADPPEEPFGLAA